MTAGQRRLLRWVCSVGSTGRRGITTSPWSTTPGRCWFGGGSPSPRPGWVNCWGCSRPPATARASRCRWRSRRRTGCWSPRCGRPGRCTRSTRWRWPATGSGTPRPGASPTTGTRWCWRTSCAPTGMCTGCCRRTANRSRRWRCWPAPSRTRCGGGPGRSTSCGRCCASTTRRSWRRSRPARPGSPTGRPARCCGSRRHRRGPGAAARRAAAPAATGGTGDGRPGARAARRPGRYL